MLSKLSNFSGPLSSYKLDVLPTAGSYRFGLNDTTPRYISIPASNDWAFGTNDFTVEWFQYQTQDSPPSFSRLFQVGSWPNHSFAVSIESGVFLLWLNESVTYYVDQPLSNYINQWNHFAISRYLGVVSVWQNGIRIWNGMINNSVDNNVDELLIGYGSDNVWNGYLTNFRIVSNSVYNVDDSTILVPNSPLSDIEGTKLLLLFDSNNLIDSSLDNRLITNYGATWSNLTPF